MFVQEAKKGSVQLMSNVNKTLGFVKSDKPFEQRLALLPKDCSKIRNINSVYIEKGYGSGLKIKDKDYEKFGVHVAERKKVLDCDIICDPKVGEALYLNDLKENTKLFGWIHAVEHPELTEVLVRKKLNCYAWEDMFKNNRHIFWENNYLAGVSAILHAVLEYGIIPKGFKVAIIGRGNTAMGANYMLQAMGANVIFFNRHMEELLRSEVAQYDIIVNAVLWNPSRTDHILYHKDIQKMKQGSMIIDVSADTNGAIEDAHATSRNKAFYYMDGVAIYAVNNTPSILYREATNVISKIVANYVDRLLENEESMQECNIIKDGIIYDKKIIEYQNKLKR